MEHKQTIVLRKDLNMRKGKMIAQGAHASMRAILMLGHKDAGNFVIPLDERLEASIRARLVGKLAGSLAGPIPAATTRHIRGTVFLPNKATAVIGMRRAGKTTFLH